MCKLLKFNHPEVETQAAIGGSVNSETLVEDIPDNITDAEFEDLMNSMMNDLADIGSDRFQFLQELKASRMAGKEKKVDILFWFILEK